MMLIWKQQQAIFEVQFMGKLSNIKALLIKKRVFALRETFHETVERFIQNSVKHLRWSFLRK